VSNGHEFVNESSMDDVRVLVLLDNLATRIASPLGCRERATLKR